MKKVVVYTPDVVGQRMAGPGIRAFHFAAELATKFDTTLVAEAGEPLGDLSFPILSRTSTPATKALAEADVVIGQPSRDLLAMRGSQRKLVFDLFDPNVLELTVLYGDRPTFRQHVHLQREWVRLRAALDSADLLIAATPQQKSFYTGVFFSRRTKAAGWPERWIEVPFGIDDHQPEGPSIDDDGVPIVLWGGGVWPWLDAETAIRAVARLNGSGTRCKLLFLGTKRPNHHVSSATRNHSLEELARANQEYVSWNDDWVRYRERSRWLLSARMALMLHRPTVEAETSIRTRMYDALWCGVPIVASAGGHSADLIAREELGLVVSPGNEDEVVKALGRLIRDDAFHAATVKNIERIRPQFKWNVVTRPLLERISTW